MDLNDPRKRLLAARQASPSLRVLAGKDIAQPNLQMGNVNQVNPGGQLRVSNTPSTAYSGDLTARSLPKPTYNIPVGGGPYQAPAPEKDGWSKLADFFKPIDQGGANVFASAAEPLIDSFNTIRDQAKVTAEARKNGANVTGIDFFNTPKERQTIKRAEQTTGIKYDPNKGTEAAVNTIAGFDGTGSLIKNIAKSGVNLVKSGAESAAKLFKPTAKGGADVVSSIAKEADPEIIKAALHIDDTTAQYLANETNPDAIKEVVKQLQVDPNVKLPDELKKRLQDEGITAVRKKDNQYGAEYNPSDRSIDVKDQSAASLDNIYHEIGHDMWANKLSPEERALFNDVKGSGYKQSAGRAGYTESDRVSEDFSDMVRTALNGHLQDVPEKYRAVVGKYARVAIDEGKVSAQEGLPAVTKTLEDKPRDVGSNFVMGPTHDVHIDSLVKRLNKVEKQIHEATIGKKPVDAETFKNLKAERDSLVKTAQEPFAGQLNDFAKENGTGDASIVQNAVEDVSKGQTGTADPTVGKVANSAGEAPKTEFVAPKAEDLVAHDNPDKSAVQQVIDELHGATDNAEKAFVSKEKLVSQEKAARINRGANNYDAAGGGEAGWRAKASALAGKYSKSGYEPISVEPEVEKTLLDHIEKSNLQEFEKFNTQNALRKVWGANPDKPTQADVNYIRRFFNESFGEGTGDEMAKGIADAVKEGGQSYQDMVTNIAGLPRALMATGDLSGGFRQALPLGTRFPKIWANANKESVKYAFNPKYFESEMKKIADAPDYNVVTDKMGVDLTGVGATQDEAFLGAGYAEKIPIANIGVKAADRAYTGVLTRMRYDVSHQLIEKAGGSEQFLKNMEAAYGDAKVGTRLIGGAKVAKSDRAMRALGEVINTFTGRGGLKGGLLDSHMKTASTILFAPRLWAANINRLNPAWYGRLLRDNPQAAKLALQSQGTFFAVAGTVLGVAAAAGAKVGMDARSADFGKIKIGNTRYDVLGGQQQNIVQIVRQLTGEKVDSTTGKVQKLGDKFGGKTRLDLFADMVDNKANPLLGFGIKLLNTKDGDNPFVRKDQYGNDFNLGIEAGKLVTPLGIQGAIETSQDVGNPITGTAMNAPSFFGIGVQTYGKQKTVDKGSNGKPAANVVTDKSGKPILDSDGQQITVDFPEKATALEKKALLDQKRKSALSSQFKSYQSEEDQSLMKLSDTQLKSYKEDGTIDQAKYDHIQRLQKGAEDWGRDIKVPEGIKSDVAKTTYQKYNSMIKKDQDYWLKQKPDANSVEVTKLVNKQRAKGLPEFKPSNELAKLYADYEKNSNSKDLSDIDKQSNTIKFQKDAFKLNYSDKQRDVYSAASSSVANLRRMIDGGKISKTDLNKAIELDNYLYQTGLNGSLQFSKKFRREYGLGIPSGGSGGGGRSGGGGSSGSKRAYLSALVPSGAAPRSAPKFSSKARTKGLTFKNVNLPKKGSGKKISINL